MCTQTQLNKITNEISVRIHDILGERLHKIILYGSYARGDYDSESDIDIMVLADIKDTELPQFRDEICTLSSDISLENDITVSIFLKDWNFFNSYVNVLPFYKNVATQGVSIYG